MSDRSLRLNMFAGELKCALISPPRKKPNNKFKYNDDDDDHKRSRQKKKSRCILTMIDEYEKETADL